MNRNKVASDQRKVAGDLRIAEVPLCFHIADIRRRVGRRLLPCLPNKIRPVRTKVAPGVEQETTIVFVARD